MFGDIGSKISTQGMVINLLRNLFEKNKVPMGYEQLSYLFDICDYWGIKVTATLSYLAGHGDWAGIPHIHVGNARIHIRIAEEAIDFIRYLIEGGILSK